jgi:hypothetical protein
MNVNSKRIRALIKLGDHLRRFDTNHENYSKLHFVIQKAMIYNRWFTELSVEETIKTWGITLSEKEIEKWLSNYSITKKNNPKTIALILAGNLPMVGFHDLICVLMSGHNALVKCASKDLYLLPYMTQFLEQETGEVNFSYTKEILSDFDAVIATGSNNAARYFDHYFSNYPNIIRKNRNGIAVLSGKETSEEFQLLGKDILQYFGLGCRNVSKLYIPEGFNLDLIFGGLYPFKGVLEHAKYANNYDYNKAVFLMSEFDFLENGFFMLRNEPSFSAPISCVHYEYYKNENALKKHLTENKEAIQCTVSKLDINDSIPFGEAQRPSLRDYADKVDTLLFLESL